MKFTREQAMQMAMDAGLPLQFIDSLSEQNAERITRLCTLAADRALEEAAHDAEINGVEGISSNDDEIVAAWLRAMKEQQ